LDVLKIKGNTYCINTGGTYIPFYKINNNDIILLDTGMNKRESKGIESVLESNNLKVVAIINSHVHMDHIGNNSYFKEKYNSIIAMPQLESLICSSYANLKLYFQGLTMRSVKEYYGHMVFKTDIVIEQNQDKLSLYGVDFGIVHTPGHSPDHICIITPDNVTYLGDTLLSYDVMMESKLPYAFILSDDLKSKEKLYNLNCDKYVIAHKGIYDNIKKLIEDNINFYKDRSMKVYELIDRPMTMEDIMKVVMKSFDINVKSTYRYYLVERLLKPHVEYLHDIGKLNLIIENGLSKYTTQ
jgi:hydroxyacylglutathione hydrolase